jgi:hypothetical protein
MRAILAVVVLAVLGAPGCGGDPISRSIGASVNAGPGTRVDLAEHAAFAWDKACVFGPYTPDRDVDAVTGIQGAAERAYDIRSNDGIDVLMFIHEHQIAASVAHRRSQGDFGPDVVGKCYSKDQAIFSVRKPPSGSWGNIGPL